YLAKYAADRVRTVATTWMGATLGCAECHDHKFDPFTTRDFYRLEAFFADVKQWGVYSDYGYTPNPELKGWTNEYPFPPAIAAVSPSLQRRQARLVEQLGEFLEATRLRPIDDPDLSKAFDSWTESSRAFLQRGPDGWAYPPRTVEIARPAATRA